VHASPFKEIVEQMQKLNLTAVVSKVSLEWGIAVKVSEIVGETLSYLLREGKAEAIFELQAGLNLNELAAGYYALVGSQDDRLWPKKLTFDKRGFYDDDARLPNLCYALFHLGAIQRRGQEIARNEAWWELLQMGKAQALAANPGSKAERQMVLSGWRTVVNQARSLARKQNVCLLKEIDDIIHLAHIEVENAILPTVKGELAAELDFSDDWQAALGVQNRRTLIQSVEAYQKALAFSRKLIESAAG
jgi:hypothetical protein